MNLVAYDKLKRGLKYDRLVHQGDLVPEDLFLQRSMASLPTQHPTMNEKGVDRIPNENILMRKTNF